MYALCPHRGLELPIRWDGGTLARAGLINEYGWLQQCGFERHGLGEKTEFSTYALNRMLKSR